MNTPFGEPTNYSNDPLDVNCDLLRGLIERPIKPGSLVMYLGHEDVPPAEMIQFVVKNKMIFYIPFQKGEYAQN